MKVPDPWSFILRDPPARYVNPLDPPMTIFLFPDPVPIFIVPVRLAPAAILRVSADDALFAMLIVEVASRVPLAMFNMEILLAFPFKKLV
jgi:hypothetical protein